MMPQSSQDPIFSLRSLTCDCIIPAVAIAVDDEKSQSCQLVLTVKWEKGNGSYLALCYTICIMYLPQGERGQSLEFAWINLKLQANLGPST